jgi:hypothetical protein
LELGKRQSPERNRLLICCALIFKAEEAGGHKKDAKKALLLAEGISFAIFHSF